MDQQREIKALIQEMLDEGVIRPSAFPYCAEIILVQKKDGTSRMWVNYRELNESTLNDTYPMPQIRQLIRAAGDDSYFVALDLKSGYWQIPMHEDSIKYTAFRTPQGCYEFVVMPFGLKTAPATFQRTMDMCFEDLVDQGISIYLDDLLLHAPTFEDCMELMQKVFTRLRAVGLTIQLYKSKFFPPEVNYLGHILKAGTITPDPRKVEAL